MFLLVLFWSLSRQKSGLRKVP